MKEKRVPIDNQWAAKQSGCAIFSYFVASGFIIFWILMLFVVWN